MSSDPLRDLERQLVHAHRRRAGIAPHWWQRRTAVLLAVILGVVTAVPAAAAVGGLWSPDVQPDPPTPAKATARATTSCDDRAASSAPGAPGADLLAVFGVLRSEGSAADRFPRPERANDTPGIDLAGSRAVGRSASGHSYFVLPVLTAAAPRSCAGESQTTATWDVCLLDENGAGGCGASGAAALRRRGTIQTLSRANGVTDVVGLVPDGVATVVPEYPDGSTREIGVARNFFAYEVRLPAQQALPSRVTWRDADGREVEQFGLDG
jgi:hypothetical protein